MSSPARSTERTPYFAYIDGLRAIAVLSVLLYHLHAPWLPGGFVGVDVFFVISGFVVSGSMAHFHGRGIGRSSLISTLAASGRIAPALIVCLSDHERATVLFIPVSWLSDANQKTGLFAFFGLSNFALAHNGRDYFAPISEFNPFTHTWSLGVEEQFYLIFPFLFAAWLGGRGQLGSLARSAAAFVASLGWAAWQTGHDAVKAYYLIPSRFWELAAGVLLFQWIDSRKTSSVAATRPARMPRGRVRWSCCSLPRADAAGEFPCAGGPARNIGHSRSDLEPSSALGSEGFIAARQHATRVYRQDFIFPLSMALADLCPVPLDLGLEGFASRGLAVGLTFLLAIASWRFVEQPVRHGSRMGSLGSAR